MDNTTTEFKQFIKGINIITPDVIRYGKTKKHIFELSQGAGFDGKTIYGVTVVNVLTRENVSDELGGCFHSLEFAEAVIADIK